MRRANTNSNIRKFGMGAPWNRPPKGLGPGGLQPMPSMATSPLQGTETDIPPDAHPNPMGFDRFNPPSDPGLFRAWVQWWKANGYDRYRPGGPGIYYGMGRGAGFVGNAHQLGHRNSPMYSTTTAAPSGGGSSMMDQLLGMMGNGG